MCKTGCAAPPSPWGRFDLRMAVMGFEWGAVDGTPGVRLGDSSRIRSGRDLCLSLDPKCRLEESFNLAQLSFLDF